MNFESFKSFIGDTLKLAFISLIIILPIRYYIVQPFFVLGASMEPTFENGDYLIVDEISYRMGDPQRGDVIVFQYPYDKKQYYIKRIVGLPGEIVSFKDGRIVIKNKDNPEGFFIEEDYLLNEKETFGGREVKLGMDEYYVLGDNRGVSSDSRRWGPLKREFIVGRVFLRVFPFDSISVFK